MSPTDETIQVPETAAEDGASLLPADLQGILDTYRSEGYALIRGLIPEDRCAKVRDSFANEVKPYKGLLPRINGCEEVNRFNEQGFLLNSLMNVQGSKSTRGVPNYLVDALTVLTHENLKTVLAAFFQRGVGLMTWNHIVANPVTRPHCDTHFWTQDIAVGDIVGVWIALEDIHAGAGRLYVYPRSHLYDMKPVFSSWRGRDGKLANLLDAQYDTIVLDLIKAQRWTCTAPSLKAGDVLLWDSRTIHGSLPTSEPQHSRSSFTSHFSSSRGRFIKARTRRTQVNGIAVAYPKFNIKNYIRGFLGSKRNLTR